MANKKVIIRTLDIGADKQADYFGLEKEDNLAMGYRAIRICLKQQDIFKAQLRALFRATAYGKISIMYPMITSVSEVEQIYKIAGEVKRELDEAGIVYQEPEQGIMIETPAAVLISDELAKLVDFFSIGTNDLTQYTLAIDRQNSKLDEFYDPHHPAILKMIQMVVDNAHKEGKWTEICGELGADIELVKTFVQMGADELSMKWIKGGFVMNKNKIEQKKGQTIQKPLSVKENNDFQTRLAKHIEEMRWLYMELYDNADMFGELEQQCRAFYMERNAGLKALDKSREQNPGWYKQNDMLGMMLYIDNFAGNLQGVQQKLDYLENSNVNYIHLMPFLDTTEGKSDGGYAVSNFRKVQKKLGTMEDLENFTQACHKRKISVCCDFVMNHTSEDHEWAKKARSGDGEYMSRYFFYDSYDIPSQYERTVPQVFPATAPGNFTWLDDIKHFVMTSFYPYQWDLNYKNPRVFNEMIYNFLYLANRGIDIIRIDAVPYIWKELGTNCRNLPQVHTIVRLMRIISEIVCPGVLLLGEVVMEPERVVPYFGTLEKPECHMLYNVTTMATTWHTVATRNVKLLKKQLDIVNALPKEYVFLNYLRCHDDIGWGLDYDTLEKDGMMEVSHKKYLNDYFLGITGNSNSRGELYNYDPVTQDARFCGTTASLCGIEKAGFEGNRQAMEKAIDLDVMLHAYMFMQSGIPVLYSGDEIGQVNDYSYKEDTHKRQDSRYLHRGAMNWENAKKASNPHSVEGRIYSRLQKLEKLRKSHPAFATDADAWTLLSYDESVLCMGRYYNGEKILGIFNFSEQDKTAWINETDAEYKDMVTGKKMEAKDVHVPGYGFYWLRADIKTGK